MLCVAQSWALILTQLIHSGRRGADVRFFCLSIHTLCSCHQEVAPWFMANIHQLAIHNFSGSLLTGMSLAVVSEMVGLDVRTMCLSSDLCLRPVFRDGRCFKLAFLLVQWPPGAEHNSGAGMLDCGFPLRNVLQCDVYIGLRTITSP